MIRSPRVLVLCALAVAGCHRNHDPVTGPATDYERSSVLALTGDEWACAPEATRVERAGRARFALTGCNVTHTYMCTRVGTIAHCFNDDPGEYAPSENRDFVLSMTRGDWSCAPEATHLAAVGPSRYALTGCNTKRIFTCNGGMGAPRCWPDE